MNASAVSEPPGRRERNKQQKLQRITETADELFTRHGFEEVTTQQIADAADIGTGTLFLYARTKAELLLLAQNSHYAEAIREGIRASAAEDSPLDAILAIVEPIVRCNRRRVENGRTYLRELVFGDPEEPHHREGLELIQQADNAVVAVLVRTGRAQEGEAALLARMIAAAMFVSLASPIHLHWTNAEICADIRDQVRLLLS